MIFFAKLIKARCNRLKKDKGDELEYGTWSYINYILETGKYGLISQPCPAIVNYLEKYQPDALQYLMPLHSPMMDEAIYLKKYRKVPEELVFLSPCIAKRLEINDTNCGGYVKYNVTFKKLMENESWIKQGRSRQNKQE